MVSVFLQNGGRGASGQQPMRLNSRGPNQDTFLSPFALAWYRLGDILTNDGLQHTIGWLPRTAPSPSAVFYFVPEHPVPLPLALVPIYDSSALLLLGPELLPKHQTQASIVLGWVVPRRWDLGYVLISQKPYPLTTRYKLPRRGTLASRCDKSSSRDPVLQHVTFPYGIAGHPGVPRRSSSPRLTLSRHLPGYGSMHGVLFGHYTIKARAMRRLSKNQNGLVFPPRGGEGGLDLMTKMAGPCPPAT
ncbi:hypothetical protein V8F06_003213 [Rhypophila decipiens]